ncbi:pantoate--beta-alanine ligase [Deinococcus altitudinis]|uniref:pantoate--beta-alanine ligase n=1 Tax=Deinococcus altitudinis TaxID=468914 RepID=UPI0038927462
MLPVARTLPELHAALLGARSVGLVPTMGYLHAGHATLIEQARRENSLVVVSVFVNPLQFGAGEDLSRYPRDLERDRALALSAGADLIFHPDTDHMYPAGFSSSVSVGAVAQALEGASRPGHFGGVATVVLKLLNMVGADGRSADRAYFGEKDWQQLMVVRQMVRDLNHATQIVGVPTVRVHDGAAAGLALSSRNSYLSAEQLVRAAVLSRALRAVQAAYAAGETDVAALLQAGHRILESESELTLDYLSLVDEHLQPVQTLTAAAEVALSISEQPRALATPHNADMFRLLIAARIFGVRLIDNMPLLGESAAGTLASTSAGNSAGSAPSETAGQTGTVKL